MYVISPTHEPKKADVIKVMVMYVEGLHISSYCVVTTDEYNPETYEIISEASSFES